MPNTRFWVVTAERTQECHSHPETPVGPSPDVLWSGHFSYPAQAPTCPQAPVQSIFLERQSL